MPVGRSEGLSYSAGQGFSALDAQAHRDRLDGFAVKSGLKPTVGSSGLEVDIASGTAIVDSSGGSVDTVTLGTSDTVTVVADSADPRKYTIYIDTNGDIQTEAGTPKAATPEGETRFNTYTPEPPFPSTAGTILAEVWVPAGASTLQSADVRDRRAPADVVADDVTSQAVSTGEINSDSKALNSTHELLTLTYNQANTDSRFGGQHTEDVSTSAKTVYTSSADDFDAVAVLVLGVDESNTNIFADYVLAGFRFGTPTTIGSTASGGAAGRTYSISGFDLQLKMASDTYQVTATALVGQSPS